MKFIRVILLLLAGVTVAAAQNLVIFDDGVGLIDKTAVNANFSALKLGSLTVDQVNSNVIGGYLSGVGITGAPADGATLFGVQTGGSMGSGMTGLGNIAMGYQAGGNLTTSNYSVFIGWNTGRDVTTCTTGLPAGFDVGIGYRNLIVDQGCENVAIGGQVLNANTLGHNNIALGSDVGNAVTTGSNSIYMGHGVAGLVGGALTGNGQVSIGDGSGGYLAGAAFNNTFLGVNAGRGDPTSTVTGSNNIAVGSASLGFPAASTGNIAIGQGAMGGVLATPQTGANSVVIGTVAGAVMIGASNNDVVIGAQSGNKFATTQNAVSVGAGALLNCTGCNNVTAIGKSTGGTLVTGTNDILIGQSVDVLAAGATNYLNIGNSFIANMSKPSITSGFGTSPSTPLGTSSAGFTVNVGTGGTASSGVINMVNAAPNAYACDATDITNSASFVTVSVPVNTFQVTLTNYSRTTGAVIAWTASDILLVKCNGY